MDTHQREHERPVAEEARSEPTRHPAEIRTRETSRLRNGPRSSEEIEDDIEIHRRELERTLVAIERKLEPGELFDEALQYLRRGPGEYFTNLGDTVKQNPVPAALVGIGLGWLAVSGRHDDSVTSYGSAADRASAAGRRASALGREGRERIGAASEGARHAAEGARQYARSGADSARRGYHYLVEDQPLLLAALGVALGMAMGAGVPSTRMEDEWMGESRDDLVQRAKETGREKLEQAESTLHAAGESVGEKLEEPRREEPGFTAPGE